MLMKTEIDVSQALALCDLIMKKTPYVTNNALARTARELVDVEKTELAKVFHERTQFVPKRVQVLKWPRPNDLWARVGINVSNLQGSKPLLPEFESGGEKKPEKGSELAVPLTGSPARSSIEQKVNAKLLYKALHMQKHLTKNGKIQYKGDQRTFVIPGLGIMQRTRSNKRRGASQRIGRKSFVGKGGVELRETTNTTLIYRFKRGVTLRAQMHFVENAWKFVRGRFKAIWIEEFVRELAGRARR